MYYSLFIRPKQETPTGRHGASRKMGTDAVAVPDELDRPGSAGTGGTITPRKRSERPGTDNGFVFT